MGRADKQAFDNDFNPLLAVNCRLGHVGLETRKAPRIVGYRLAARGENRRLDPAALANLQRFKSVSARPGG